MSSKFKKGLRVFVWLVFLLFVLALLLFGTDVSLALPFVILFITSMVQNIGVPPEPVVKVVDRGAYYRVAARYLVDGVEPVDFDLVAACGYNRGIIVRDRPPVLAKRTRDNHAVVVTIPDFCDSARSRKFGLSNSAPSDGSFLPLTIWFDDADKLEMGLGYASVFAYENPTARLTFLGSTIRYASREEFLEWRDAPSDNFISNEILETDPYSKDGWIKPDVRSIPTTCYGVGVIHANAVAQEKLQKHWPEDKPDFWMMNDRTDLWHDLHGSPDVQFNTNGIDYTFQRRLYLDWRISDPFRGASLNQSKHHHDQDYEYTPTEHYPVYFSDAISAVADGSKIRELTANIDMRAETKGFFACYRRYPWSHFAHLSEAQLALIQYSGFKVQELSRQKFHDLRLLIQVNGEDEVRANDVDVRDDWLFKRNTSISEFISARFR